MNPYLTFDPVAGKTAHHPTGVRVFLNLDFNFDFSDSDHFLMGAPGERRIRLPYPDLLINFYGDFSSFKVVSFADAVNNTLNPEDVKGSLLPEEESYIEKAVAKTVCELALE